MNYQTIFWSLMTSLIMKNKRSISLLYKKIFQKICQYFLSILEEKKKICTVKILLTLSRWFFSLNKFAQRCLKKIFHNTEKLIKVFLISLRNEAREIKILNKTRKKGHYHNEFLCSLAMALITVKSHATSQESFCHVTRSAANLLPPLPFCRE